MKTTKTTWTSRKKKYYNYKNAKKAQKASFFKIASLYNYAKIDCEIYVRNFINPNNPKLTSYYMSFTDNAMNSGDQIFEAIRFKKLLSSNNEFNSYKIMYQVLKVRGLALKLFKIYDPIESFNDVQAACLNTSLLKLVVNMNAPISGNELTYGSSVELYPHQQFYNKYYKNNVSQWTETSFPEHQEPSSVNNGQIQVVDYDGNNEDANKLVNFIRYKLKLTFYILFKNNKYN